MSAAPFDPAAYVADMRAVGAQLVPLVSRAQHSGQRLFSIQGQPGHGIPGDVLMVMGRWEDSALAHSDWVAAVHDVLVAEGVTP